MGFVPSSHPHSLGYACTLYTSTSPLPTSLRVENVAVAIWRVKLPPGREEKSVDFLSELGYHLSKDLSRLKEILEAVNSA